MGINEVSAMCRGVVMSNPWESPPTNKECDCDPDSASEAFYPADTLERELCIVAQPSPTIVLVSDLSVVACQVRPHSALAMSTAPCHWLPAFVEVGETSHTKILNFWVFHSNYRHRSAIYR